MSKITLISLPPVTSSTDKRIGVVDPEKSKSIDVVFNMQGREQLDHEVTRAFHSS